MGGYICLSDPATIKELIRNRWKFDQLVIRIGAVSIFDASGNYGINEDIRCLYMDIDRLMSSIRISTLQKKIMNMFTMGYSRKDIAEIINISEPGVGKNIDTICSRMAAKNTENWQNTYF